MKTFTTITILTTTATTVCGAAVPPTPSGIPVIIDIDHIIDNTDTRPIDIPEGVDQQFCKNWVAGDIPDELYIQSNGNSRHLYSNTEFGFSSLWSTIPQMENILSVVDGTDNDKVVYELSMVEFINMMSYTDHEFIKLPVRWQFSNCMSYKKMMSVIKTKVTKALKPIEFTVNTQNLVNAVDTTGCLDDSTCVKRLCFPVDPTNIYNYDQSQMILYDADTRMCYKYTGKTFTTTVTESGNKWYKISDSGAWD
jgi:hypothetical protein